MFAIKGANKLAYSKFKFQFLLSQGFLFQGDQKSRMNTESTKTAEDWFKEGLALGRLGQNEKAIEAYKNAVEQDPGHFKSYFNMGIRYGKIPMNLKAAECFQKSVELRPDDPMGHYSLAVVSNLTGQTDDAIRHYREAIRLDPEFAKAHSNLAMLHYSLKQGRDTIHHLREAHRLFAARDERQMVANAENLLADCYKEFGLKPEDFD